MEEKDKFHNKEFKVSSADYTEKEKKLFDKWRKQSDPIDYFVNYARYNSLYTLRFPKDSELGDTSAYLKDNVKKLFYSTSIKDEGDSYIVNLSFSDMIKLFIINDIRESFWFSSQKIQRILLLMRYTLFTTFEPKKNLGRDMVMFLVNPVSFHSMYSHQYWEVEATKRQKELEKEIKEKGIYAKNEYFEDDMFEKILYYMMYHKKVVYMMIGFDRDAKEWIRDRIAYIHDIEDISWIKWIIINLFHHIWLAQLRNKEKSLFNELWNKILKSNREKENALKRKHELIKKLSLKFKGIKPVWLKKDNPNYEKLRKEILIHRLEAEIGVYTVNDWKKTLSKAKKKRTQAKLVDVSLFEAVVPHINNITSWDVTLTINKSKLEEFSIYSKLPASKLDEIKKEYPYAEIWGVQYEGKRQYTTLRYKKKLK